MQKTKYLLNYVPQIFLYSGCSGYKYEHLVLSDLKEIIILSIKQSSSFSKKSLPKLQSFYDQYLAPELAHPRLALRLLGQVIEDV